MLSPYLEGNTEMGQDRGLVTRDFLGLTSNKIGNQQAPECSEVDVATLSGVHGVNGYGVPGSVISLSANIIAPQRSLLLTGMLHQSWTQDDALGAQFGNLPRKFEQPLLPAFGGSNSTATAINNLLLSMPDNQQHSNGSHLVWPNLGGLQSGAHESEKEGGAELTIVYKGSIHVYDGISDDQASAIMSFADTGRPVHRSCLDESAKLQNIEKVMSAATNLHHTIDQVRLLNPSAILAPCEPVVPTALPLARKASLARFLEKRKERMQMKAPYMMRRAAVTERFSSSNYGATPWEDPFNIKPPVPCGLEGVAANSQKCNMAAEEESYGDTVGIVMP